MTASAPSMLKVTSASKSFGATQALRGVDLDVAAGEIHALVGENGSGKSTLIKILAGFHTPDRGTIEVGGEELRTGSPESSYALGCRFVHQDLGLIEDLSVADNLCVGSGFPVRFGTIRTRELRAEAERMMAAVGLDLDPDTRVADLSPAVRTGLALARALRSDAGHPARLLVLDEPTATMPDDEVTRLLAMVRHVADEGAAVLYVSHRLEEILQLCARVTVLRDGRRIDTLPVAGLTRRDLVDLLVGPQPEGGGPFNELHVAAEDGPDSVATDHRPSTDGPPREAGAASPGLRVSDLRAPGIRGLDLEVAPGSIVGVAGITGSGRESVLATIFGAVGRTGGAVEVDGTSLPTGDLRAAIRAGVSYLPPDRKALGGLMDLTARENLSLLGISDFWRRGWLRGRAERDTAREWFARLSVRPAGGIDLPLAAFSGGNQQKVLLGKWLRVEPRVLLLDEPTQGVDIGAKAVLHEQVLERARQGAAVVVSSTDVEELVGLCDRVVVLADGRQATELRGPALTADNLTRACLGSLQET